MFTKLNFHRLFNVLILALAIFSFNKGYQTADDKWGEYYWRQSDGACALWAVYRGDSWKLNHAHIWNKYLSIRLARSVVILGQVVPVEEAEGHLTFVFEDSNKNIQLFSNGAGSANLGKVGHDAKSIATAYYKMFGSDYTVLDAHFVE